MNSTSVKGSVAPWVVVLLRALGLGVLAALLAVHVRSLRVFRWEQRVAGGVLVTYTLAELGLVICSATNNCTTFVLPAYLCGTGAVLLAVNAGMLRGRWLRAGSLAHAVADLLDALGLPVHRQIRTKVLLSAVAALLLFADLAVGLYNKTSVKG